jgi:phosphohistidine phosphatase
MPKSFIFVRHAKSSWAHPELEDKMRPLNARGKRDGPFMAQYCRKVGIVPDKLLSSPAKRAYRTAKYFSTEFDLEISKESDLYFGHESDWMYLINDLAESVQLPAFFSHNPTITYFSNKLGNADLENVPTCGVVHFTSKALKWSQVGEHNTQMTNFYFPKLVRQL